MQREARAYLWDIAAAASSIRAFTAGKNLDAYLADEMLRAAVERKFGIVGEALSQLLRSFPESGYLLDATKPQQVVICRIKTAHCREQNGSISEVLQLYSICTILMRESVL